MIAMLLKVNTTNLRDFIAANRLVISNKIQITLFGLWELEIWQMTQRNNKEHLSCSLKLCVSFHSHPLNQIGVVIEKHWNQSQIFNLSAPVTLKFGTFSMPLQAFCIIWSPSVNSNWSYRPETPNLCQNCRSFTPLWPWPLASDFDLLHEHYIYQW